MNNKSKFPNLFNKSKDKPKRLNGLSLLNEHKPFVRSIQPDVLFYKDFLKSFSNEKLYFSNFVEGIGISGTSLDFNMKLISKEPEKLVDNLKSIDLKTRRNSSRIKQILAQALSVDLIEKYNDVIYESYIYSTEYNFDINSKGTLRFFTLYGFQHINTEFEKAILVVILVDPYHLVCPVSDRSKNLSSEDVMQKRFNRVKSYSGSLENTFIKYFSTRLDNKGITKDNL